MVAADVVAAAQGAEVIVHGANPPGYRNWAGLQMPMLESTIAAAKATGARHPVPRHRLQLRPRRLPDPDRGLAADPDQPQGRDPGEDGAGAEGRGVPVLIVRAGDYFGQQYGTNQ